MALSNSEHTLLVETCENMNIAAVTCQQVLDMLRSLGASGVVDIATHNNSQNVHANAKNLAQVNTVDGSLSIGGVNPDSYWPTSSPLQFLPKTNIIFNTCESKGNNAACFSLNSYKAITNSSGQLIELSTAGESVSSAAYSVNIYSRVTGLNNANTVNYGSNIYIRLGNALHSTNFLYSSIWFYLGNGTGNSVLCYNFSSESLYAPSSLAPSLGILSSPFSTAYFQTAATVVSDRREKANISTLDSKAVDFVKALRPVAFTVNRGVTKIVEVDDEGKATKVEVTPGVRHHWGLIAQDVQESLTVAGYDPSDCAVWQLSDRNDPDSQQALRYEELIAPMIKVIQNQQERIEALERKVA